MSNKASEWDPQRSHHNLELYTFDLANSFSMNLWMPYLCQKNLLNSHPPLLKEVLKVRKIQPEIRRLIGESFILKTFKKLMLDVEWLIYRLVMNTHQDFTPLKWTRYIYIYIPHLFNWNNKEKNTSWLIFLALHWWSNPPLGSPRNPQ